MVVVRHGNRQHTNSWCLSKQRKSNVVINGNELRSVVGLGNVVYLENPRPVSSLGNVSPLW